MFRPSTLASLVLLTLTAPTLAQTSLRAALKPGQDIRCTVVIDQRYTNTYVPPNREPTERSTLQQANALIHIKDVSPEKATIEISYESYKFKIISSNGETIEVDAANPAPANTDTARTNIYAIAKGLTSAKFTLTVKPDGSIDTSDTDAATGAKRVIGNEELLKNGAARLMRRLIEVDGLKAIFNPVLALRTDKPDAAVADKWTAQWIVLADRGREGVTENRTLEKLADGKAYVKGSVSQAGKPGNVGAGGIYLRDCLGTMTYTWDTASNSLEAMKVEDNITLVMMNPDQSKNEMNTFTTTTIKPRMSVAQPPATK